MIGLDCGSRVKAERRGTGGQESGFFINIITQGRQYGLSVTG